MVVPCSRTGGVNVRWTPPSPSLVKINVDAAWKKETLQIGIGIVARNDRGAFIRDEARYLLRFFIEEAEAEAILAGVFLAKTINLRSVIIETDAKCVIECVPKRNHYRKLETLSYTEGNLETRILFLYYPMAVDVEKSK
ncbi:PREDICTED: Reverse mRNAase zinc-binding domain [Prunus dulcis]|uniref:PREDICTED: Reverse mRNAase zinc-binding domain n=1 Tax=Prunus dulcis TaxID=3755 RepID=A0A5E4FG13_PRUDU|nr:PREDICTED: Reverse mRNAase zinc-binding domain [Prunus dulcis]